MKILPVILNLKKNFNGCTITLINGNQSKNKLTQLISLFLFFEINLHF